MNRTRSRSKDAFVVAILVPIILLVILELVLLVTSVPDYIFPRPTDIWYASFDQGQTFIESFFVTTEAVLYGLLAAIVLSTALVIVALFGPPLTIPSISAYSSVSQSIPLLAIVPLLSLWFGHGLLTKVVAITIACFFPLLSGWLAGFRAVSIENRQLFENMHANKFQRAWYLMIPSALPYFFGGLRVAGPLALLGAIVAEFLGSSEGLGFQILNNSYYLRTPVMFAYLYIASGIGTGLIFIFMVAERLVLFWHGGREKKVSIFLTPWRWVKYLFWHGKRILTVKGDG